MKPWEGKHEGFHNSIGADSSILKTETEFIEVLGREID
jgi:hypothetical protein